MKKIIAGALAVVTATSGIKAMAKTYSDIPSNAWYTGYVNKISDLKGFTGYEDGTFRPNNQITQQEFVKTVVAMLVGELPEDPNQKSYPEYSWQNVWDTWAQPYLNKAIEFGIITEEDWDFKYYCLPCTRGAMAKVVTRAAEYMGEEKIEDTSVYQEKIKDYKSTDEMYREYVLQAYGKGIISGYENGTFQADKILTRAEASSVLVRLMDKDERVVEADPSEKLYDYFDRQVTFTEPLRTDVPKEYQVSIADHEVISQASFDRAMANGGSITKYELNRSKGMMFEDLVLQSIRYEGDTITLTVPDLLPESQEWSIGIDYWDIDKDYDFTMMKHHSASEPGTYKFDDIKVLERIDIIVYPKNSDMFLSGIFIENGVALSLQRKDKPEVSFNNLRGINNKITGVKKDFEWIQGQGYKEYVKDYQFDEDDIVLEW